MSEAIITVENLGKRYHLGTQSNERYTALRDVIANKAKSLFRRNGPRFELASPSPNEFWALKNVGFEVKRGEVVGIIGRNGAGKSTLLKILSRITDPTEGRVRIKGRVASLLEVGTGFHPELTGRENIFLNGAILGMHRHEIKAKFDEIVAFAEIERFLDTPVKRYSSGMYVRLAFAVAAHLEPEILVVDEVLAVGDAQFQKKCLGKISQVSHGDHRTVLLVSHNMAAIQSICSRAFLIQRGNLVDDGSPKTVVAGYLASAMDTSARRTWNQSELPQNENIALCEVSADPPPGESAITIDTGLSLAITFINKRDNIYLDCTIYIVSHEGVTLFESGTLLEPIGQAKAGRYLVAAAVPGHLLNAGRYHVNVLFGQNQSYVLFKLDDAVGFEVEHTVTGRGANMHITQGVIRPLLEWKQEFFVREGNNVAAAT